MQRLECCYFPENLKEYEFYIPHFLWLSGHSELSGLSDGNEGGGGGGRHEGRSTKRHQRRSVRSRSRHDKISKAKLNVLNVRTHLHYHFKSNDRNILIAHLCHIF